MKNSLTDDPQVLEAGIDEAGRGSLCGRVYAAAVILPHRFTDDIYLQIKDSKRLSKKKRQFLKEYIEKIAIAYSVQYAETEEIDELNILQATMLAMHRSLDNLSSEIDQVLIDGNYFRSYKDLKYVLVKNGDNLYRNIAAASILAKTYRDEYMENLVLKNPELESYGFERNMGYGTKQHMNALVTYGPSIFHRKSFKTYNKTE